MLRVKLFKHLREKQQRLLASTLLDLAGGFLVCQRFVGEVQDHDWWSISSHTPLVCTVCVGPHSSPCEQKDVIHGNLEERVWQQLSLIDNSRPRVWNAHNRCKKMPPAQLKTSWNAFVIEMWCESVWPYFWRDLTLKGPVKKNGSGHVLM